jgi:mono/diheme cytochrome c family protein
MKVPLLTLTLAASVLLFSACSAPGGRVLYEENCETCHSFKGEGGRTAPDLTAVTALRSEDWIRRQIREPSKNDPRTRMPAFGQLSRGEIRAIIRHLGG